MLNYFPLPNFTGTGSQANIVNYTESASATVVPPSEPETRSKASPSDRLLKCIHPTTAQSCCSAICANGVMSPSRSC